MSSFDIKLEESSGSGAPTDATYVTLSTNSTLTNERVLTAGDGITITDAGAGSTVTVATKANIGTRASFQYVNSFVNNLTNNADFSSVASAPAAGVSGLNGIVGLRALSVSTVGTTADLVFGPSGSVGQIPFGVGIIDLSWTVAIPTGATSYALSTSSEEYTMFAGLASGNAALSPITALQNKVGFVYDRATDGDFWTVMTQVTSGTPTKTVTAVAVAIDTLYTLRLVVNAAGTSVAFYINDTLVHTETSTIPTADVAPRCYMNKTVGSTARLFAVDHLLLKVNI